MQSKAKAYKDTAPYTLASLRLFTLSRHAKFAIKASLSVALAYLIPFSQGWPQATTAATTVMLIATMGPLGDSINKGVVRIVGTIVGATIGMLLVGLFPQDRVLYLLFASIIVTVLLYLARAYRGEPAAFLLTSITLLMMFQNGDVENSFIYGIDKTFMTILGIVIFTVVGLFLWPVHTEQTAITNAQTLLHLQSECYSKKEENKEWLKEIIDQEQILASSVIESDDATLKIHLSQSQWNTIVPHYKHINELLLLLSFQNNTLTPNKVSSCVQNYQQMDTEIKQLFDVIALAWKAQKPITLPDALQPRLNHVQAKTLSHLERAILSTTVAHLSELHEALRKLAQVLNALISPVPTLLVSEETAQSGMFLWFDIEHLKGALLTFVIFWTTTLLWIYFNPPGGFLIVTLATGLSILTTFSPVKPSSLLVVFSLAFVFATVMYIFVLPHLRYAWELGLFLFGYAFIGFYFLDAKTSIFFLLGIVTLGLANEMNYQFDLFLLTLFVFYAFLFLLLLFYYIPFSTKPEHLFLAMKKRFFTLSSKLVAQHTTANTDPKSIINTITESYCTTHLLETAKKMGLWASKVDEHYFEGLDKKQLLAYAKACESLAYVILIFAHRSASIKNNTLLKALNEKNDSLGLLHLLDAHSTLQTSEAIEAICHEESALVTKAEAHLVTFFEQCSKEAYSEEILVAFYENISLRRNIWLALLACQKHMHTIDFRLLERSKF